MARSAFFDSYVKKSEALMESADLKPNKVVDDNTSVEDEVDDIKGSTTKPPVSIKQKDTANLEETEEDIAENIDELSDEVDKVDEDIEEIEEDAPPMEDDEAELAQEEEGLEEALKVSEKRIKGLFKQKNLTETKKLLLRNLLETHRSQIKCLLETKQSRFKILKGKMKKAAKK